MDFEVINPRQMRSLELNAEYFGISRLQLMENAGHAVASEISARFPSRKNRVAIFCGLGGNGGDGFVLARHLLSLGYPVEIVLAGHTNWIKDEAALKNWYALRSLLNHLEFHEVADSSAVPEIKANIVVDALLGIGLRGVPKQPVLELIKAINQVQAFRVAVDMPTGLDSSSGQVLGVAVEADLTVTFYKAKPGLTGAKQCVGELVVKDIGLPRILEEFAGPGDVISVVKDRPDESHKGDFGKLLVVGGSETFSGAPALVALAGLRAGVDLAYVAAPEKTARAISSMTPNLITIKLRGSHLNPDNIPQIESHLTRASALVVGPGLGIHEETQECVRAVIAMAEKLGTPLVLDADGLKALASFTGSLRVPSVMTPHEGEFTILTGKKLPLTLRERIKRIKKAAKRLNATILLKGSTDIISDGEKTKLNFSGNPGMTVGGTGDVLAGIIGALLAQQVDLFEAAVAGAFINGAAGDFAENTKGYHLTPTDLLDWIPKAMDDPMSHKEMRIHT